MTQAIHHPDTVIIEGAVVGTITIELDPPTEEYPLWSGMLNIPIDVEGRRVAIQVWIGEIQDMIAQDLAGVWKTGHVAAEVFTRRWEDGEDALHPQAFKGSMKELVKHMVDMHEFEERFDTPEDRARDDFLWNHGERVCPHCDRQSIHKAGQETIPPTWVYQCATCTCTWDATMFPRETSHGCQVRLAAV